MGERRGGGGGGGVEGGEGERQSVPSHGWAREHQEKAGEKNMREAWRWRRDAASLTCAHACTHTANGIESLMLQGSGRRGCVSRSCHLFPPISRRPGGFPLYFPHPLLACVSVAISNREAQEGKGRAMRTGGGGVSRGKCTVSRD